MGWQTYPIGLTRLLEQLSRDYRLPPVYITENGAALDDTVVEGRIHDAGRAQFIADHLAALSAAATVGGVDVRGFFAWSLLDNLEWGLGFDKTFGLVHIDRKRGLKRTIKDSGLVYARIIAECKVMWAAHGHRGL